MRRSISNPEISKTKKQVSDRIDKATLPPTTKNAELYIKLPILTTAAKLTLLTPDDVDSVIPPNNNSATDNNPFTFFSGLHSPPKKPRTDNHFDKIDKLIEKSLNERSCAWFSLLM